MPSERDIATGATFSSDNNSSLIMEDSLRRYRRRIMRAMMQFLPAGGDPPYLYELVRNYPSRSGKGLRPALCMAGTRAFGGKLAHAIPTSVALELFHNAFLLYDDVQDESFLRRGAPTLHTTHGIGIAVNVGNATSLIALQLLADNRPLLGSQLACAILEETEQMLRKSLEGQALELAWIRDNIRNLRETDYYRMCLRKTTWYSFIYPLRAATLIARCNSVDVEELDRFAWYVGAAFQIQDDLLNLNGDESLYGKEICGDIWEGKRTIMLIHLLRKAETRDRRRLEEFLMLKRADRTAEDVRWVLELMNKHGSIGYARHCARSLANVALHTGETAFCNIPPSRDREFLLSIPAYVISRKK